MKRTVLTALVVFTLSIHMRGAETTQAAPAAPAIEARLTSAIARTAYEEFMADLLAAAEKQAAQLKTLDKDVTKLSAEQARAQLAFLESMALTRTQLGQTRRAILACCQLSRDEAELLLGELATLKTRWDRLLAEEIPARKAALVRQIDIAAVAVLPPPREAQPERTSADVLQAASRRLRATGIASIGGEYHIMLDGQRMRAGQTVKVQLDREYVVTLVAVSRNSYTLELDGETLVVPME